MIGVIVSIDEILVRPDDVARFAARCHAALGHLSGTPGCRSAKLTRSLADPARFLVITEWDSVETLERDFYRTERFVRWREEVSDFFLEPPRTEQLAEVNVDPAVAVDTGAAVVAPTGTDH